MEPITLENIDKLIDRWQEYCDDLDPHNVDSLDRPAVEHVGDAEARQAICLLAGVLREHKKLLLANKKKWWHRLAPSQF